MIQASHRNYSGFECRRKLIRIKPNIILIIDEIKPYPYNANDNNNNHKFEQLFHTSSNIIVKVSVPGREVCFLSKNSHDYLMRILQSGSDSTHILF